MRRTVFMCIELIFFCWFFLPLLLKGILNVGNFAGMCLSALAFFYTGKAGVCVRPVIHASGKQGILHCRVGGADRCCGSMSASCRFRSAHCRRQDTKSAGSGDTGHRAWMKSEGDTSEQDLTGAAGCGRCLSFHTPGHVLRAFRRTGSRRRNF